MPEEISQVEQPLITGAPEGAALLIKAKKAPRVKKADADNQLASVIGSLAKGLSDLNSTVASLASDVAELKAPKKVEATIAPSITVDVGAGAATIFTTNASVSETDQFLSAVPANLLKVAKSVLGEKFSYKCEAVADTPHFAFTVIVPPEYSPVAGRPVDSAKPNGPKQVDERTRVIPNSLGANGVREWCTLVRNNVVKYLGQNLPADNKL
jgi:hypothetical protein